MVHAECLIMPTQLLMSSRPTWRWWVGFDRKKSQNWHYTDSNAAIIILILKGTETVADTKTYCKSSSGEISEKHHTGKPFHFSPLSAALEMSEMA